MAQAFICDAVRTPIGRYGGALSSIRTDDLAALPIKALLERNRSVDWAQVDDAFYGCANQAGEDNRNVARMAVLLAGLPESVPAATINRLCGSGMDAVSQAARAIVSGDAELVIAGGVESMSRAPFVMPKADAAFARHAAIYDTTIGWRFVNPRLAKEYYPYTMGDTAENVAKQYNISREDQDFFAFESQRKYHRAAEKGRFRKELVPVFLPQPKGDTALFDTDEQPRISTLEKLASLRPAFQPDGGTVTAGNSAGINDGAAAALLVNDDALARYNLKPMVKILSSAVAGVDPSIMGMGPVPAIHKALERAGLTLADMDLIELNEAFAAQTIACIRELGINTDKMNVNGGSIAIGHPLGSSGSRITATLLHEMQRREGVRYGLATMCVGVGQGAAVIYERL